VIEADIDHRFAAPQRFTNEIAAECTGKAAGIVIPHHIVADIDSSEQLIEIRNS
jgi:hypothetical protein